MRKFLIFLSMLVAAALFAAPVLAQGSSEDQYAPAAGEEISATGLLRDGLPADVLGDGTHSITDESTNTLYALRDAGANLDAYVDQSVTVYGTLTPGEDLPGSEGIATSTLPSIDVTRVEPSEPVTVELDATVTFELTIDGPVPEGQYFGVDYPVEGQQPGDIPLCTTDPKSIGPAGPLCESGGTYSGTVEVPANEEIEYAFQRYEPGGEVENFQADTFAFPPTLSVVEASYSFSGEEPGQPTTETFQGYAADVGVAGMRVDSDQSGEPCTGGGGSLTAAFTPETEFSARRGNEAVPITVNEVGNGDPVEVSYTLGTNEAIPAICPSFPIDVDSVTVLEDEAPGGRNPEPPADKPVPKEGSENPNGESNDTGNEANDPNISVLPDTGGIPLAFAGIALFSAAGGLLIRRLG